MAKFEVTVTKTVTTSDVNMRLEIHEADSHAPVPGGLYGSIVLVDDRSEVLARKTLTPDHLNSIAEALSELKSAVMQEFSIEEVG